MSEYAWLGDPNIPAKEQRARLNFTHCEQPSDVMVDMEHGNVTTRCKCGVRVRHTFTTLVQVLEFLDAAGLPHDIGLFLRAHEATRRGVNV